MLGTSYAVKSIYGPARFIDSTTPSSLGIHTLMLDATVFHQLFTERIIAMLAGHARSRISYGGELDQSDLFRVGGFYTIRGFRESELLASRLAYGNLEIRFMMSRFSYLFVFLDGGYLVKDVTKGDEVEQASNPLSYGLGAQVESPLGVLAVSLGVPRGEPFDQAKIHFGIVKQF